MVRRATAEIQKCRWSRAAREGGVEKMVVLGDQGGVARPRPILNLTAPRQRP